MKVKEVVELLEEIAPLTYAEDFDNTGLLVGNPNVEVSGILVTLDSLESVVDEAIQEGCNMIVSFHPIIFKGLKKITGKTYVERVVLKAIKHDISIYAIHTALDNAWNGVNSKIADILELKDRSMLIPKAGVIQKLTTYVPKNDAAKVRQALFDAGAGAIGNYDNCSFNYFGNGTFKGNEASDPTVGKAGEMRMEEEVAIGITFQKHLQSKVLKALTMSHPYEEVAYEITTLENTLQHLGMGILGEFDKAVSETNFLEMLKNRFHSEGIRHSKKLGKSIKKVAVLGGSGSFAIGAAKAAGADAFVTADLKYHDYFAAEDSILLVDIGHYESEQFTKQLLVDLLTKKISNFAPALAEGKIVLSKINTNPVRYF